MKSTIPSLLRRRLPGAFSLVEMLAVIAVIGIMATIAIPVVGSTSNAAAKSGLQRDAQSLASMFSMAAAAGASVSGYTSVTEAVTGVAAGLKPTSGPFKDQLFRVPGIPDAGDVDRAGIEAYLEWDNTHKVLQYKSGF